jgi:N-acetylmuramoyl-L-alanine amidase
MIKKTFKAVAQTINAGVAVSLIAFTAFHASDLQAQAKIAGVAQAERDCLQQNIFFEARNQSVLGQVAVAWVTLNRVGAKNYPSTICGVVWQDKQFSWTHDGKSDRPADNAVAQRAWEDAALVADVVLIDWARARTSPVGAAVMYHADYVQPYWAASYKEVTNIDAHIFYQ